LPSRGRWQDQRRWHAARRPGDEVLCRDMPGTDRVEPARYAKRQVLWRWFGSTNHRRKASWRQQLFPGMPEASLGKWPSLIPVPVWQAGSSLGGRGAAAGQGKRILENREAAAVWQGTWQRLSWAASSVRTGLAWCWASMDLRKWALSLPATSSFLAAGRDVANGCCWSQDWQHAVSAGGSWRRRAATLPARHHRAQTRGAVELRKGMSSLHRARRSLSWVHRMAIGLCGRAWVTPGWPAPRQRGNFAAAQEGRFVPSAWKAWVTGHKGVSRQVLAGLGR